MLLLVNAPSSVLNACTAGTAIAVQQLLPLHCVCMYTSLVRWMMTQSFS